MRKRLEPANRDVFCFTYCRKDKGVSVKTLNKEYILNVCELKINRLFTHL